MTPQIFDTSEPETLRFGYGDTALGTILVAESKLGVMRSILVKPGVRRDAELWSRLRGDPA